MRIKKPPKSGSLYHNYKGFFSVILMALVDAEYRFRWVDIGLEGSCSDAQIFNHGELREKIEDGSIVFREAEPIELFGLFNVHINPSGSYWDNHVLTYQLDLAWR